MKPEEISVGSILQTRNCFLTKGSRFAYHHTPHLLTDRFKPYLIPKRRQCSYLQKVSRKTKGSRMKEEESDVVEARRVSNPRFQTPRLLSLVPLVCLQSFF